MSYSYPPLPNGVNYYDPSQLPALLELFENNISRVYNDGSGNPTIGIGMNLTNSDNMALVLYQIAPSLFTNQPTGLTAQQIVAQFEYIVSNNPLTGQNDHAGDASNENPSTATLINALNQQLETYLNVSAAALTASFANFSPAAARTALQGALKMDTVLPGYGAITGYSQGALNWLQGGNKFGITVAAANIPALNTGAWEALVSLFFNQQANKPLLGRNLMTALNTGDPAQVWFEIRYGSNLGWQGGTNDGVAERRYAESQLFGLPADTYAHALQAYETLTANRTTIISYEKLYGTDPDTLSTNPTVPGDDDIAVENDNLASASPSIAAPVAPVQTVAAAFNPEAESIRDYLNSTYSTVLPQKIGIANDSNSSGGTFLVKSTDILVATSTSSFTDSPAAPDIKGQKGTGLDLIH